MDRKMTPAFPWCGDLNDCPTINLGMDLRDYFAAKALAGMYANPEFLNGTSHIQRAKWSYSQANAMMEARK